MTDEERERCVLWTIAALRQTEVWLNQVVDAWLPEVEGADV